MSDNSEGRDKILDGLTESIREYVEDNVTVFEYVVVVGWLDGEGNKKVYSDTFEGQRASQTMGLLEFGSAHEHAQLLREVLNEDS